MKWKELRNSTQVNGPRASSRGLTHRGARSFKILSDDRTTQAAASLHATCAMQCSKHAKHNVAALLVIGGYLMRFFFLIQAGTKKMTGSNNAFFFGGGGFGVCCSCVLMVNLKAATT